jgi:hypothetical protein
MVRPEGRLCGTKPIRRRAGDCAKQTQFGPAGLAPAGRLVQPHHSSILSFHHSNPMSIVRNEANFGSVGGTRWLFLLYSSSGGGYTWGFCVHFYVHGLELIDYEK